MPAVASGRSVRLSAVAIVEGVHLLLDDVGHLADGALEQLGALEQRHADLAIAVGAEHAPQHAPRRATRPPSPAAGCRSCREWPGSVPSWAGFRTCGARRGAALRRTGCIGGGTPEESRRAIADWCARLTGIGDQLSRFGTRVVRWPARPRAPLEGDDHTRPAAMPRRASTPRDPCARCPPAPAGARARAAHRCPEPRRDRRPAPPPGDRPTSCA